MRAGCNILNVMAQNDNLHIAIQGLDTSGKAAGIETNKQRADRMQAFIAQHAIPAKEIGRINDAIDLGRKTSFQKQERDESITAKLDIK